MNSVNEMSKKIADRNLAIDYNTSTLNTVLASILTMSSTEHQINTCMMANFKTYFGNLSNLLSLDEFAILFNGQSLSSFYTEIYSKLGAISGMVDRAEEKAKQLAFCKAESKCAEYLEFKGLLYRIVNEVAKLKEMFFSRLNKEYQVMMLKTMVKDNSECSEI